MSWVSLKSLQRDFGLPWMVCEQLIREQVTLVRKRRVSLAVLNLTGMLWGVGGARWLLPSAHGWVLAVLEIPGLLLIVLGGIVLPRLMAGQAILAAAQAHAGQPSTGNTLR